VHFVTADVSSAEEIKSAIDVAAGLGDLRMVVNCAGVATPGKVLGRGGPLSLTEFERVLRINLAWHVLRASPRRQQDRRHHPDRG
jgi:NAD(P)-dependent dehydrogenase (short-subunit alcohol dehydrogenase family)